MIRFRLAHSAKWPRQYGGVGLPGLGRTEDFPSGATAHLWAVIARLRDGTPPVQVQFPDSPRLSASEGGSVR